MASSSGFFSDGASNIRRTVTWILFVSIAASLLFVAAYELPAYNRRSELQRRVSGRSGQWPMSPFARPLNWFRSRSRLPESIAEFIPNDWLRPLEPVTAAQLYAHTDEDVRKLASQLVLEVELEEFTIVAADGECTDQLLRHLIALPNLRMLSICNIPITDQGIDLLLQMPRLKELHIECAAEPSPGLERLSELRQIETLGLLDSRCRVPDAVDRQIAAMPKLRDLRLINTPITTERCRVMAGSRSLECVCFAYLDCNLTLEQFQILAALPTIRSVDVGWGCIDQDAEEYLKQRDLLPEEEVLLGLPRL